MPIECGGTVSWEEFSQAHAQYLMRNAHRAGEFRLFTRDQLARLGGFGYDAMTTFLGYEPTSWIPDSPPLSN